MKHPRLKQQIFLLEKNLYYKPSNDPEALLNDFYILTLLKDLSRKKLNDESLDFSIEEAVSSLLPYLKKELLSAVLFSISAEFRHVFKQNTSKEVLDFFTEKGGEEGAAFIKEYYRQNFLMRGGQSDKDNPLTADIYKDDSERYSSEEDFANYVNSYNSLRSALKVSGMSKAEMVSIINDSFNEMNWPQSYGGNAWSRIANGWLKLNNTKSLEDMAVWIDHVYDLQHNTDTVFNKINKFKKEHRYDWIAKALDFKRDLKNPWQLYDKVSPSTRSFISYISPKIGFGTLEDFKNPNKKYEDPVMQRQKDNLLKSLNGSNDPGALNVGNVVKVVSGKDAGTKGTLTQVNKSVVMLKTEEGVYKAYKPSEVQNIDEVQNMASKFQTNNQHNSSGFEAGDKVEITSGPISLLIGKTGTVTLTHGDGGAMGIKIDDYPFLQFFLPHELKKIKAN